MQTKLIKKEQLTSDVFRLTWAKPTDFSYLPGQFISFTFPYENNTIKRFYSLASHPSEDFLMSIIKMAPLGKASKIFENIKPNDDIAFGGPFGRFILAPITHPIMLVATGTGISPEFSMLKEMLIYKKITQPIKLFFGLKNKAAMYLTSELATLKKEHHNFDYCYCLSDETQNGENIILKRTTDYIIGTFSTLPDADWYICGIPQAIMETEKFLFEKAVPSSQIHFEHFTPAIK